MGKEIAIKDLQDESNLEGVVCGNTTSTSTSSNIAGGRLGELKKDLDKKAWEKKVFEKVSNCIFIAKDDTTRQEIIYKVDKNALEQISTHLCQDGAQFLSDKDLRAQFQIDIPKRKKTYEFEWEKEADLSEEEEIVSVPLDSNDMGNTNTESHQGQDKPLTLDEEFDSLASGADSEIEVVPTNSKNVPGKGVNAQDSTKQSTNKNIEINSNNVSQNEKEGTVDPNDVLNV